MATSSYERSLPLPDVPITAKVVGVSFTKGYPENLLALKEHTDGRNLPEEHLACVLVRNPDNVHDANAIQVHSPVPDIGMIGHVNAGMAARLAPELDAGIRWRAELLEVLIHPDHMDRPGITLRLSRAPKETDVPLP